MEREYNLLWSYLFSASHRPQTGLNPHFGRCVSVLLCGLAAFRRLFVPFRGENQSIEAPVRRPGLKKEPFIVRFGGFSAGNGRNAAETIRKRTETECRKGGYKMQD